MPNNIFLTRSTSRIIKPLTPYDNSLAQSWANRTRHRHRPQQSQSHFIRHFHGYPSTTEMNQLRNFMRWLKMFVWEYKHALSWSISAWWIETAVMRGRYWILEIRSVCCGWRERHLRCWRKLLRCGLIDLLNLAIIFRIIVRFHIWLKTRLIARKVIRRFHTASNLTYFHRFKFHERYSLSIN